MFRRVCGHAVTTIYPTFTTVFTYDKRGRKTSECVSGGDDIFCTRFEYDAVGNLVAKTDREDRVSEYEYDALNRLVMVVDPADGATIYAYDVRDNLASLTDANDNITQFIYDKADRLFAEYRPMGEQTTYYHDGAGRLTAKQDAKNQQAQYVYDDAGRLVEIRYYTQSGGATPVKTVEFGYDNQGNLISYDDGTTSAAYDYDDLNRKISETVNYGAFSKTNAYTYYENGLKETFTGPDNITYGFVRRQQSAHRRTNTQSGIYQHQ